MSNLDRVTEAARALVNLGLPDNCVYSERTPFEQAVIREFIQACFDARRSLQDDIGYSLSDLEGAREDAYEQGHQAGYDEGDTDGYDRGWDEGFQAGKDSVS